MNKNYNVQELFDKINTTNDKIDIILSMQRADSKILRDIDREILVKQYKKSKAKNQIKINADRFKAQFKQVPCYNLACGVEFTPTGAHQKYCARKCNDEYNTHLKRVRKISEGNGLVDEQRSDLCKAFKVREVDL